jgi:hypothetical protein
MNYPNDKYIIYEDYETGKIFDRPKYSFRDKIIFYFQNKKLIKNWERIYDIKILDPDGWDREDLYLFDRYYTKEEFENASCYSTCEFGVESVNFIYKDTWKLFLNNAKERWDIVVYLMQQEE